MFPGLPDAEGEALSLRVEQPHGSDLEPRPEGREALHQVAEGKRRPSSVPRKPTAQSRQAPCLSRTAAGGLVPMGDAPAP